MYSFSLCTIAKNILIRVWILMQAWRSEQAISLEEKEGRKEGKTEGIRKIE